MPGLQAIIVNPPDGRDTARAQLNKLLGQTTMEEVALDVHIAIDALYCLGQCTIAAEVLGMNILVATMAMSVIGAVLR